MHKKNKRIQFTIAKFISEERKRLFLSYHFSDGFQPVVVALKNLVMRMFITHVIFLRKKKFDFVDHQA